MKWFKSKRAPVFVVNSAADGAQQFRVNISATVKAANIREELYNNRLFIVLPSKTLPDNIVMNEMLYPAAEIAAGFKSLEGTQAPLGHPVVNGEYVSAGHPEAYLHNVGAFNKNVRRENGSVYIEKWIDKAYAEQVAPQLMAAINAGKPISTSTGLTCNRKAVTGKHYKWIAQNMVFDHDAILLDEAPAAGVDQGVGMLVNQQFVINSVLEDSVNEMREILSRALPVDAWLIDYDAETLVYDLNGIDHAAGYAIVDGVVTLTESAYTVKRKTIWERITGALTKTNPVQVNKMDEELKAMLTANAQAAEANATAIAALTDSFKMVADSVASIQSEQVKQAEITANAALADKRKVVALKMGEVVANALAGEALDAAVAQCQTVDPLVGGFHANAAEFGDLSGYTKE